MSFKSSWNILIVILLFLAAFFFFMFFIPVHMDAFGHYHTIMCQYYPLNSNNIFREACGAYDLAPIPGWYLPLRACPYIGSFQSLLYLPLFLLWPSPYSANLLGLLMLVTQAFLLSKIFKINMALLFAFLIFFMPYSFQHIVDFGTLSFQTTSVFLIYYLTLRWIKSAREGGVGGYLISFSIGFIIFLGIWTKFAYFSLLFGIMALICFSILYEAIGLLGSKRWLFLLRAFGGLVVMVTTCFLFLFILLNSQTRSGEKLLGYLDRSGNLISNPSGVLVKYLFDPLLTAERIFILGSNGVSISGVLLILITLAFLIFGIWRLYVMRRRFGFVILNVFLFFFSFSLMSRYKYSWAMHHVVLCAPFLILALVYVYSQVKMSKFVITLLVFFFSINALLFFSLTRLSPKEDCDPGLIRINTFLNERYSDQYVFIVMDWGMYFIKALYGNRDQCVLYIDYNGRERQMAEIKAIVKRLGRKAVFIGRDYRKSDMNLIGKSFPGLKQLYSDFGMGYWCVWYQS